MTAIDYEFTDRFWGHVDRSGGDESCWPWLRQRDRKGYGVASVDRRPAKAHRVAWAITHGEWPDSGMMVCHSCDNPSCVNPDHLWLGTAKDNYEDSRQKGRNSVGERHGWHGRPWVVPRGEKTGAYTHPESLPRGEKHGNARLTDEKVREIRSRYAEEEKIAHLARSFGVSDGTIRRVVLRTSWRHVEDRGRVA